MDTKKKKFWTKTNVNILIDITLLVSFLIVMETNATGIAIHEWLGVAILVSIIIHILVHWGWVSSVSKRFFKKLAAKPRLNYFVDLGIFTGFITIIFSGLMISQTVLPFIGLKGSEGGFWKQLHFLSTDVTVYLTALHLALHWHWIKTIVGNKIIQPLTKLFKHSKPAMVPVKVVFRNKNQS